MSASRNISADPTITRPAEAARSLSLLALPGIPAVKAGDDLASFIVDAVARAGERIQDGDIFVVAHKIVSKAEGRVATLADIDPSPRAVELGRLTDKDPRLVEIILRESTEVLRHRPGLIVVVHRLGFVMANAGVDASNVESGAEGERVLLLPEDPDRSCRALRLALQECSEGDVGVVVNDSIGRAWRRGIVGHALGVSGIPAVVDLRGRSDLFGRRLQSTEVAMADELAAAASLLQGQADEGVPVILVRGIRGGRQDGAARDLLRPREMDLFR